MEVANPLAAEEAVLRRSMLPGLLRALAHNVDRRQADLRLFEVGTVFCHPDEAAGPAGGAGAAGRRPEPVLLPSERELASVVLAATGRRRRAARWPPGSVLAEAALGLDEVRLGRRQPRGSAADRRAPGLHPTRSARLVAGVPARWSGRWGRSTRRSWMPSAWPARGPDGWVGWRWTSGVLLGGGVPRRPETARPVSRYPSSDVDLALVVADERAGRPGGPGAGRGRR